MNEIDDAHTRLDEESIPRTEFHSGRVLTLAERIEWLIEGQAMDRREQG